MKSRLASLAAIGFLLASPAHAQDILFEIFGTTQGEQFGQVVAGVGDLDLDGYPDFAVSSPRDSTVAQWSGKVTVFSGFDASVLFVWYGFGFRSYLGASLASAGDVNSDGYPDVIIGEPQNNNLGFARVFSGFDGAELLVFYGVYVDGQFGCCVAGVGDIDGDGFDDVAVGATKDYSDTYFSWKVRAYSGFDGHLIHLIRGPSASQFGLAVAGPGDVDDDGVPDILVGAPSVTGVGAESGAAYVVSGATGDFILEVVAEHGIDLLGDVVAAAGDIDGDHHADIAVGSPNAEIDGVDYGSVFIHSGATGARLARLKGPPDGQFSKSFATGGDFDGDGIDDVVSVAGGYDDGVEKNVGAVIVSRTSDGAPAYSIVGDGYASGSALCVAGIGDVNLDGVDDFVLGAPDSGTPGRVRVYAGGSYCPPPVNYCVLSPNSVGPGARIGSIGAPSIAADGFVLTVTSAPTNQFGLFYYGPQAIELPFGDGTRCVGAGPLGIFRLNPPSHTDLAGSSQRLLEFTELPASHGLGKIVIGSTWYFQFWYRDPAAGMTGFNLSDGLQALFYP